MGVIKKMHGISPPLALQSFLREQKLRDEPGQLANYDERFHDIVFAIGCKEYEADLNA